MLILVELMFFYRSRRKKRIFVYYYLSILAFAFLIPAQYGFNFKRFIMPDDPNYVLTYLFTQFRVILKYMKLLIWPTNQTLDYDFPRSESFFEFSTFISFVVLIAILLLALKAMRRRKLFSFGIFWFFIALSVESSIIPINQVISEQRLYLPSVGFLLAICSVFSYLINNERLFSRLAIVLAVALCMMTFQRNQVWQSKVTLWEDVRSKAPNKARAYNKLGSFYLEEDRYQRAFGYFNKAIELRPVYGDAYMNRGMVYFFNQEYDKAMSDFEKAEDYLPSSTGPYKNKGTIHMIHKRYNEALHEYDMAIKIYPFDPEIYGNRGIIYSIQGKNELALSDFNHALNLNPDYGEAYNNRGLIFARLGRYLLAIQDYSHALDVDPNITDAYLNRSLAHKEVNEPIKALEDALMAKKFGYEVKNEYIAELEAKILEQ